MQIQMTAGQLADLAESPKPHNLDAESLLPVLRGETDKHRDYVLTEERPYQAIRTDKWKLINTYNDVTELYDMQARALVWSGKSSIPPVETMAELVSGAAMSVAELIDKDDLIANGAALRR